VSEQADQQVATKPSSSIEPISASHRYERLLYAPIRPAQQTAAALAAAVPLVVGALLVWAIVERPARQAVGIYLVVLAVAAGLFWLVASPVFSTSLAVRFSQFLQSSLLEILRSSESKSSASPTVQTPASRSGHSQVSAADLSISVTMPAPNLSKISWLLVNRELSLTRSNDFSVFALWPDTECYLTSEESRGLSAFVARERGLRASALTAISAAAGSLAVDAYEGWHEYALVALTAALLLVAVGSYTRCQWVRDQLLYQKAQLVAQHGPEIIGSYDLKDVTGPVERRAALRRLSISILERSSGLPARYRAQNAVIDRLVPQVATAVGESIDMSLQQALRLPAVANVKGSISVAFTRLTDAGSQLKVKIATGADAWQTAADTGATRFDLSGGEDRPSASFEVVVEAPGLEVAPREQEAQLPTSNASTSWTFALNGPWADDVLIWVTLYSSSRYVQAIQLSADELERHDTRN